MIETNRFSDRCAQCGAQLAAGAGVRAPGPRGGWATWCPHHTPAQPASPVVRLVPFAHGFRVELVGRLNGQFDAYRRACKAHRAETRKNHIDAWETIVSTHDAPGLVRALQAAGLRVEAPDAAAEALAATAARQETERAEALAGASVRLDAAAEALASRGLALRSFQREGVRWLTERRCGLLCDSMGLGKTCQALLALPEGARVVVICPAVAKGVWRRELATWRPDLTSVVLAGRNAWQNPEPSQVVILNYDILPSGLTENVPEGMVLILDEAHAVKGGKSARTKKAKAIAKQVRDAGGKVWLLTATPLLNRPGELYSLLSVAGLEGEAFGGWQGFKHDFGGYDGKFGLEWGSPRPGVGEKLAKVMLRRLREEVAKDIPPKSWQERAVDLDGQAFRRSIKDGRLTPEDIEDLVKALESDDEEAQAVAFTRLSAVRAALAAAKTPALLEVVEEYEEAGEPVVVFSAHREPIDALGAREGWAVITGDTSADARAQVQDDFQSGKLKGVAATIQAGGVAITLTKACHAIFVDRMWTPGINAQAEDRVCRLGQTRPVQIVDLVADHPLDTRIASVCAAKRRLISRTVESAAVGEGEAPAPLATPAPLGDLKAPPRERWQGPLLEDGSASPKPAPEPEKAPPPGWGPRPEPKTPQSEAPVRASKPRTSWPGEDPTEGPDTDEPHPPRSPLEEKIAEAVWTLTARDTDKATLLNGEGWSKSDCWYGQELAVRISLYGLTDRGWVSAAQLVRKYRKQLGWT